jgi:hypothetical protein
MPASASPIELVWAMKSGSTISTLGGQSRSICLCSGAASRQLSGMNSAPSLAQENSSASISGLLKPRKDTQSPRLTPDAASAAVMRPIMAANPA